MAYDDRFNEPRLPRRPQREPVETPTIEDPKVVDPGPITGGGEPPVTRQSWEPNPPDDYELPLPPPPPGPPMGDSISNSPLALPSSFAIPGTRQAAPFRSTRFLENRVFGPQRSGAGATLVGGADGFSELSDSGNLGRPETDDDLVRRIVMGLSQRRG